MSSYSRSPSGAHTQASPSLSGSPCSSLFCWLLCLSSRLVCILCIKSVFPYRTDACTSIAFGHLRYEPGYRGSSSYIVPLNDEEIELYHIGSSPLSTVNEEPSQEELYRRHIAERPLPPEPVHRRRRSGRGSPFPTLISPLSDPFIEQDARLPTQNGRNTIRLVPESSRELDLIVA